MPNHCINELIFRNVSKDDQARILAAACNAEGNVDFDVLVPTPPNVWIGSVGQKHEKAFKRIGLEWSRENWGTKWNAYSHQPTEQTDDTLTLRFETAWGPPYGWLCAMFNTLKMRFEHNWFSEGGAPAISGIFDYASLDDAKGGEPWEEKESDDAMQKHMHKLLYGVEEFPEEPDDEEVSLTS